MNEADARADPVGNPTSGDVRGSWWTGFRHSVFWRVAAVLFGAQIVVVALAVAVAFWLAYDRSLALAGNSLRLRLDSAAEEMERRSDLRDPLGSLPLALRLDVRSRFEDPVFLIGTGRDVWAVGLEGGLEAPGVSAGPPETVLRPALEALESDSLVVAVRRPISRASWAVAPLYDADGFQAGGLLVFPLERSLAAEMAETRSAYRSSMAIVSAFAGLLALFLGLLFTWQLVRPLRNIAARIEAVGEGRYDSRLEVTRPDEFGRLARSVNEMADRVEGSVRALRTADELRRQMVANVGHDLRTPLAALMGYIEEAGRYAAEQRRDALRGALETAMRQAERLRDLVNDLFELSVLDGVSAPLRKDPIPLGELLRDVAASHRSLFRSEGIEFAAEIEQHLPVISGDGVRLIRVLDNLLVNARQHTPSGGKVSLAATRAAPWIIIEVRDSGPGIPEDQIESIFERYYRGTGPRTRTEQGTGLGLAISRAISRAHGGNLSARNLPEGGAAFTLRLPLP